jgi:thiol-disulfide isomerase/thioredoxin
MKTILIAAFSLLAFLPLRAQPITFIDEQFSAVYQGTTAPQKITGQVLNLPETARDTLKVGFSGVSLLRDEQDRKTVALEADGTFSFDLPENYPLREVWFALGDHYYGVLLVEKEIHVELDFNHLGDGKKHQWDAEGVRFSGFDGELTRLRNQLIANRRSKRMSLSHTFQKTMMNRALPTENKLARVDSIYDILAAMDAEVLADAPDRERELLENERVTERLANTIVLYWNEGIPAKMKEQLLAHHPLAMSNETRSFYSYYSTGIKIQAFRQAKEQLDTNLTGMARMEAEADLHFDLLYEEHDPALADVLALFVEDKDPLVHHMKLEKALSRIKTPWVKGIKQRHLARSMEAKERMEAALAKKVEIATVRDLGEPAGSFDFGAEQYVVEESLTGQELLDKIRGAFPDQAIYLDFWAVWCAPCLAEMPHSAKLHHKVEGLPVKFVYLCTDSGGSQEQWENLIAKNEVPGIHLFVPQKVHGEVMKIFNGRGYPTYVLLQPDGSPILDVSRPSGLSREKIESYLEE